jgi:hypothetical protein
VDHEDVLGALTEDVTAAVERLVVLVQEGAGETIVRAAEGCKGRCPQRRRLTP